MRPHAKAEAEPHAGAARSHPASAAFAAATLTTLALAFRA